MRLLLALALLPSIAFAADPPKETGRNFNNSLEVPDVIPTDRCILAIMGPELREERGFRLEWWHPPISDRTLRWFYIQRRDGRLKLQFCEQEEL